MRNKYLKVQKLLTVGVIALGVVMVNATAQQLPAPINQGPASSPSFPSAFTAFNPPVHTNPLGAGVPEIAEWTRANNGGDTMALTGYNLGSDFKCYSAAGGTASGQVKLLDGMEAAVQLPGSIGSKQFTLLWNGNASGYGRPVTINGTDAWWVGPERATRGQSFSVYGENLGLTGNCYLYLEGHGWIESDAANPYKADFTVPAGLANGTYTVWAHNGQGEQYGWGKSLELTVYDGHQWNDDPSTWLYVQRDFGAAGDGVSDDSSNIKAALAAADDTKWSTVYFEPGTYRINSSIVDSLTDVRLKGAGMNSTKLVERVGGLGADLLDLNADRCEISDMTVETDAGSVLNKNLLDLSGSEDIVLRRLVVSQLPNAEASPETGDPVALPEEYLVRMIDCIFHVGSTMLIKNADQIFIEGCQFYALTDANSIMSFSTANDVSIINTTGANYDIDAGLEYSGAGRFVLCNPGKGAPRNWYYGGNSTIDLTTHTDNNNHNAAEDFMFESTDTEWYGTPASVNGNVLSFANVPSSVEGNRMYWIDYTAIIVEGKGLGQARTVVDYDTSAGTLTLDEPFRVQPDETSIVYFGFFARRVAVYDNRFDGHWDRVKDADDPADAAVETYGGSHRLIVDSNTITEKETAFYVHCRARPTVFGGENTPPPNYFGVYKNNIATRVQTAARLITTEHNQHLGAPLSPGVGHIGHVFRKNHFDEVTEQTWQYEWRRTNPGMTLMVFDKNTANDYVDDYGFEAVHTGSISDTPPSTIENQILVDAYLENASEPPPPDGPPAPVLSSIEISGATSVNEESSGQYICTATYSDGSTTIVSPDWDENSSYTTISSSGVLSAGNVTSDRSVTITASYGGMTDTHAVTVNYVAPVLTDITISGSTSVNEETSAQYSCTATYSDGTSTTVTPSWSENSSYATINSSGLLNAGNVTADQNVTITASFGGQTDTHAVTINYVGPVLTGIAISGPASVDEQTAAQYSCTATYSDGTSATVVPNWNENSSFASINSSGLFTAGNVTSDQSVTVTASFGGRTDTQAVTINFIPPTLTSVTIAGPTSLDEETTAQYSCTANWSDGTSASVVPNWSENSSYATISAGGVLNAGDVSVDRSLTVTASYGGMSDTHGVTILYVEPPVVVTGISISGPAELDENSTADFNCIASYSDGTTGSVNPAWSENAGFASINPSGVISVGNIDADSTLTVTASYDGFTDTQELSVLKVGTRIVYPLSGFSGKLVRARLWDDVEGELIPLGEMNSPDELVISDVNPNQWYWVVVEEYDESADDWVRAHANWISM